METVGLVDLIELEDASLLSECPVHGELSEGHFTSG